jgi:hypothetical protein
VNRRALISSILAIYSSFGLIPRAQAQTSDRRDGNWWRAFSDSDRLMITIGFIDGIDLGKSFTIWGMDKVQKDACMRTVIETYDNEEKKYLANVTAGQLKEGLDDFYKDYKNRLITLYGAAWLVLEGISGYPKDDLDKAIENWRKNANSQ